MENWLKKKDNTQLCDCRALRTILTFDPLVYMFKNGSTRKGEGNYFSTLNIAGRRFGKLYPATSVVGHLTLSFTPIQIK